MVKTLTYTVIDGTVPLEYAPFLDFWYRDVYFISDNGKVAKFSNIDPSEPGGFGFMYETSFRYDTKGPGGEIRLKSFVVKSEGVKVAEASFSKPLAIGETVFSEDIDDLLANWSSEVAVNYKGSSEGDSFRGGFKGDIFNGKGGDDMFGGFEGRDSAKGGAGDDLLWGSWGQDTLKGGGGHDLLIDGAQDDKLVGGKGNDVLMFGDGDNTGSGGRGSDVFVFGTDTGSISTQKDGSFDARTVISDFDTDKDVLIFAGASLEFLAPAPGAGATLKSYDQANYAGFSWERTKKGDLKFVAGDHVVILKDVKAKDVNMDALGFAASDYIVRDAMIDSSGVTQVAVTALGNMTIDNSGEFQINGAALRMFDTFYTDDGSMFGPL